MLLTLRPEVKAEDLGLSLHSRLYRALDVAVLHWGLLGQIFGFEEAGLGASKTRLGFTQDEDGAVSQVDRGEFQMALFLNPTPIAQVVAVAKARETMPQKSTYFFPKLLTGLVINPLFPTERLIL